MPTVQPAPEEIAEAAYFLWLAEGCPEGREEDHWHRAQAALYGPRRRRASPRAAAPARNAPAKKPAAKKPAAKTPRARKASPDTA